jgi:hypothetical protein
MSSRRVLEVPADDAISGVLFALCWPWLASSAFLPVHVSQNGSDHVQWRPLTTGCDRLGSALKRMDVVHSLQVRVGLPQKERDHGVWSTPVLHCWVSGKDQVARAARHRATPSISIRCGGTRRLLLWGLGEPVDSLLAFRMNRRLAYSFGAPQKAGDPSALWVPLPGTYERVGRARPQRIDLGRLELDSFTVGQVVGSLRDPPDPNAWRERNGR